MRMPTTKKRASSKRRDTRGQKRCPHCGALMPARWFSRHLAEKHGSGAQPGTSQVIVPAQPKPDEAKNVTALTKQTVSHRQKKLQCPHCDRAFARPSSLATHIHYLHPGKSPATTALRTTTLRKMSAPASASAVAPKASVEHHLKTALQELTQRQHDIDEQLNRIDALQSEKETITRQIDAVTAALQAFQR
jgi:uncharacterized C2H2 Zn-finger protein